MYRKHILPIDRSQRGIRDVPVQCNIASGEGVVFIETFGRLFGAIEREGCQPA